MKEKNYEPIRFEFFQTDMEKIMLQLDNVIKGVIDFKQIENIKTDIQHKINIHKRRGEWK